MDYLNLDLAVEARAKGQYAVRARSDAMGEATGRLALDVTAAEVSDAERRLASLRPDRAFLTGFGEWLFERLFAGEVRDLYRTALGQVLADEERGLRLRLSIDAPELAALPWEVLFDRSRDCFLASSAETPLTRYIRISEPIRELRTTPPVKVLVTIPGASGLDVEAEKHLLRQAVEPMGAALQMTFLEGAVTRTAISDALIASRYDILHFIGHGAFTEGEGHLLLNGEPDGSSLDLVPARTFGGFFRDYPWTKLVVLNACQGAQVSAVRPLSGVASQLVRRGVPAVVAMQYAVADEAAILFAREFYVKLCTGWNRGRVDAAISHARNRLEMDLPESSAFVTPVLFMRSPTGLIFDLDAPEEERRLLTPAAELARLKTVKATHASNLATAGSPDQADPAQQETLAHAREAIRAVDRRLRVHAATVGALVLSSTAVFFASWIGLFNAFMIDDWLERRFVGYMDAFVEPHFDERIVLVLADEDAARNGPLGAPGPDWRCHHAELVSGLAAAPARLVAFDLFFEDPSACDEAFAEAIAGARQAGTRVVLGTRRFDAAADGTLVPAMAPRLRHAAGDGWGILEGRPLARRVTLAAVAVPPGDARLETLEAAVAPSFALRAWMEAQRPADGRLASSFATETHEMVIRGAGGRVVRTIPVADRDLGMIVELASRDQLAPRRYHDVLANARDPERRTVFADRIVVVGYASGLDRWPVTDAGERFGVELQASAISNLFEGLVIRPIGPWGQFLAIFGMALVGVLLRTRLSGLGRSTLPVRLPVLVDRAFEIPVALLAVVLVYLLAAFVLYKQQHLILDIGYHVGALVFTYWLMGFVRQRVSVKQT